MLTKPIFIIALHRTGSTLLQNMIGANSAVAIATNEMQLFLPFRASFGKIFREIGDMSVEKNVDKLFRIINSGNIAGTFWREYTQLDISLALIKKRFRDSDRTLKDLIDILLSEYLSKERKSRTGVKYPLHFYKLKLLDDWFPDSKIIVLHRDLYVRQ